MIYRRSPQFLHKQNPNLSISDSDLHQVKKFRPVAEYSEYSIMFFAMLIISTSMF